MADIQWLSINKRKMLIFDLTGDWAWDDCRPLAQHALLLQASDGAYPTDAIFDLTDCRTEPQEMIYSIKRLLDLRVIPNIECLTLIGNRKRIHMLAQMLDDQMPFQVRFARRIEDVKPVRRSKTL